MAALAADPRAGSHRSYRRTLDKEEPPPALFPPDASDPSQDDSPHASTTDPSQTCQSADGGQPWINGSKRRLPDWDSFYKNGLPNEIIVIDDTPEPGLVHPNAKTDAYHPITSTTKPNTSKKRKLDDALSTTHHYEHLGGDNGVDLGASAKKRKYEKAPEAHRPHLYEDGVSNGIEPSALLKRPYGVRSPILNSNSPASLSGSQVPAKRKRTRHQLANGVHAEQPDKPRLGPNIEYVGLGGPAQRAKDVLVRPGHSTMLNGQKLHDDDGHYIVVPEASITNQYKITKLLGQGTFGKVVQAFDLQKKDLVAVKIIRSVQKYRDAAKLELRVLQTLRQNDAENRYRCIHLRDCFDFHGHICIVMDLLDSSLFDFLKANSFVPFPNSHIQSFARQLLTSVAFLHDLGLIHTDLKPENILLRDASYQAFTYNRTIPSARNSPGRQAHQRRVLLSPDIRLIDFGSATFHDEYHSSVVSTRHYRAPEIILGLGWSYPCDIWSIGCILVEFFTGDALFQTHDNLEHLAMMEAVFDSRVDVDLVRKVGRLAARGNGAASYFKRLKLNYPTTETSRASKKFVKGMKPMNEIIPPGNSFMKHFLDLLQKMFVYDPARRITAKEALQHPWFREIVRDDGTEAARIAIEGPQPMRPAARKQAVAVS